ncbi:MAG: hypothetical protein OSA99_17345 [Acidimicrobiales bacterium]|nr:hypothetical protein [Acidimicrobiales bacterium]
MNRRIAAAVLAAGVVGGLCCLALPQHAASIVRLVATAVAVYTGGLVLRAVAPVVAREPELTALDHVPATGATPLDPHGLRDARRDLDRPTAPGTLPASVRDRLVDIHAVRSDGRAETPTLLVSPAAGTATGAQRDPAAVARLVHRILDDLDSTPVRTGATDGHH